MTLQDIIKELGAKQNSFKDLMEGNSVSFNDVETKLKEKDQVEKDIRFLSNSFKKTIKDFKTAKKIIIATTAKKGDASYLESINKNCLVETLKSIKEKENLKDNIDISNLSYDDAMKKLDSFFSEGDRKNFLEKNLTKKYLDDITYTINTDISSFYESIINELSNDDIKNIENEYDKHLKEREKTNYIHENEKEINELINSTNDEKTKDILKDINDNILAKRTEDELNSDAIIAEEDMRIKKKILSKDFNKELNKGNSLSDYIKKDPVAGLTIEDDTIFKDKDRTVKEFLSNYNFSLSDDTKKTLNECLHILDSFTSYKDGSPLFDLNTFKSEEQIKVYAFKNFDNLHKDITESIKNKDTEKLVELHNIYKEETKKMDNLMEMMSSLDTYFFPGNVSLSRNASMPVKYAKDYKAASQINGLWHTLSVIKKMDISIEKFTNDPLKAYMDYLNKNKNLDHFNELKGKNTVEFIKNITDKKKVSAERAYLNNKFNNFRAFEAITFLENKNINQNYKAYEYFRATYGTGVLNNQNKMLNNLVSNLDTQAFKNIIITNNQVPIQELSSHDNKYIDILSGKEIKKFDYNEYIKNNEIDLDCLVDTLSSIKENNFNGNEKQIFEACKEIALDMIKTKDVLNSDSFTKLCELGNINPYKAMRLKGDTVDIGSYLSNEYKEKAKNGIDKENIITTVNTLKAVSEQYNKRTIFGRLLRKEGRHEKALIDTISKDLKNAGIDENLIKNFKKGNIEPKEFINSMPFKTQEVKEVKNIIKEKVVLDCFKDEKGKVQTKELNKELSLEKDIQNENNEVQTSNN